MKYYRVKAGGNIYSEAYFRQAGLDPEADPYERVTVKPWKPKRLKVGDRVVTTSDSCVVTGLEGTVIHDDGSSMPFQVLLDFPVPQGEILAGMRQIWGFPSSFERA